MPTIGSLVLGQSEQPAPAASGGGPAGTAAPPLDGICLSHIITAMSGPVPVLTRTQRNDILQEIRKAQLDPAVFEWSTEPKGNGIKEVLTHPQTSARFEFSAHHGGGLWLVWWPNSARGEHFLSAHSWGDALSAVAGWLSVVHDDHLAPDLWGEITKEKTISGAANSADYQNSFSPGELKLLETGLADIEHYITTTQPLDPAGQDAVHKRFTYLLDAAKRGARKIDWINIFVGQLVGLVMLGLIDPKFYRPVMAHAATALNAVFHFGLKLIE